MVTNNRMEIEYRILNLYRTRQYDLCLKLCAEVLQEKQDRMIQFIQMRALTIQAKITGNGYEEVDYGIPHDELNTTAIAKTPRVGTSFHSGVSKTSQAPLVSICDSIQQGFKRHYGYVQITSVLKRFVVSVTASHNE